MSALILAGILDDLGINPWVVLVQGTIFFLTFLALKRMLFGRLMHFMTERESDARRSEERIHADRAEAERLVKEYEAHLARIDKEAWERLQAVMKEAIEARGRVAAEAQAKAAQETKAALEVIARERQAALESLRKEIPAMAQQAVQRVIGVPLEPDALATSAKGGAR